MVDQSKELEEIEIFIAQNRRFVDWSTFNVRGKNEEFSQTKTTHLKVKLSTSNSAKSLMGGVHLKVLQSRKIQSLLCAPCTVVWALWISEAAPFYQGISIP